MQSALVTIFVLNFNGERLIGECLDSLKKTEYGNHEIIVIDNGSTDRSLAVVGRYSGIRIIRNSYNMGFARAFNIGFKMAPGKYVVTLNNDVTFDPAWLSVPVDVLEKDDSVGIVGCRQMDYYQRDIIDAVFYSPTRSLLPQQTGRGKVFGQNPLYGTVGIVMGASGAAVIYRKKMLEEIGGFEDSFFAYHEESDLFFRAFFNDWKFIYVPSSIVYHKGSATWNTMKKSFFYYHERNRIWFIYRNFPLQHICRNIVFIVVREMRTFLSMVRRGMFFVYIKARKDGFIGMFRFSDERKKNIKKFFRKKDEYLYLLKHKIIPLRQESTGGVP